MQQESVEIKEAEMKKIREQIEQVALRFRENSVSNESLQDSYSLIVFAPAVLRSSARCLLTSALRSAWTTSESTSRST